MGREVDLHVVLSSDLAAALEAEARVQEASRAQLVREAIAEYLGRREAERVAREMTEYVESLAPHSDEFVRETRRDASRRLLRETEW